MTGEQTIDTSHAIVTQAAQQLHYRVVDAKGKLGAEALHLGQLLAEMQESRAYTALGFATFEDYLASDDVAMHRNTAYRFIRVFKAYPHVAHGRHWHRRMDIQKLDILSRLIDEDTDPAQIEALVEQAREMPREELRAAVNDEARRRGILPPEERDAPVRLIRPAPTPAQAPQATPLAAGLGRLVEAIAADPKYRARELQLKFGRVGYQLGKAATEGRLLMETTTPEEMARTMDRDELEWERRHYERDIKPLLAWYEEVLASGQRGVVARVK